MIIDYWRDIPEGDEELTNTVCQIYYELPKVFEYTIPVKTGH